MVLCITRKSAGLFRGGESDVTVGEQACVFAAMLVCGAALGALYDGLALVRRMLRAGAVMTGMLDVSYGLCCGAGVVYLALCLRTEAFRLYVLLGAALGIGLYMSVIGMPVRILDAHIRKCVKKSRKVEDNCQEDAGKWELHANNM